MNHRCGAVKRNGKRCNQLIDVENNYCKYHQNPRYHQQIDDIVIEYNVDDNISINDNVNVNVNVNTRATVATYSNFNIKKFIF